MVVGEKGGARNTLVQRLQSKGIELPEGPAGEGKPGRYLFRGSPDKTPLFTGRIVPSDGEMGTSGVFFADSQHQLIIPQQGIIYIYESNAISKSWVAVPSPEYNATLTAIQNEPENERLRRGNLTAALETEAVFYTRHSVYQARRGIATSHISVSVADALHIFVTKGYLTQKEFASLPPEVRAKIEEY